MKEDLDWAMAHHAELERQFLGELVAVWQKQIVANGRDEAELLRRASAAGFPAGQLVIVELPVFFESPH
jgi:hypothetical protein